MFNYDVIFKFWDGAFNYQGFIEKAKAIVFEIWALLLVQMMPEYNCYQDKGFAPIYARDNFENCWKEYDALVANGVMNNIHDKFMIILASKAN